MKVLVIGKPAYNILLPLDNYPKETDKIMIPDNLEYMGGNSLYIACFLAKWGIDVAYTGVIGGDANGTKIKKDLDAMKVDTRYLEVNYEKPTSVEYILLNKSTGNSTQIIKNDVNNLLLKYKYDFVPDFIIMDGTDMNGSLAAINNFPRATSILLANKVNDEYYNLSKKCTYVIANLNFAKALTKMEFDYSKPKVLVNIMQKIKDLNKASYIIMLKERGVLYTNDHQVKMVPAINVVKKDDSYSSSAFLSGFAYGIINQYGIDTSVKFANISAGLSLTKSGLDSIPEYNEVLKLSGVNLNENTQNAEKLEV